ncbi:MAG: TIM-barrel domain-containing protein [Bacteroidota bacterium]
MKKYLLILFAILNGLLLSAQNVKEGKWLHTFYPGNIVKLTWQGTNSIRNEKISDAVIAAPLISKKLPVGIQLKRMQNSITVKIKGATVHFLNGFDSVHHRGAKMLLQPGEKLFGAGERALPLNRIGQRITLYNNPWYGYGEGADQLNYSVPVLLSSAGYGLLFDNPSKGYFDVGKTTPEIFEAGFESGPVDIYIVPGKNMDEILRNYTSLTGKQPLPPRWAMGNFVSRFGYRSQQQAEDVIKKMKHDNFPADAIIIDLFWFGDSIKGTLGNLDWNRNKWPDPETMISNFKKQDLNTILVTEPFILRGTKNYVESLPYLAIDSSGKPYTLQDFYFGKGGLVDLFQPKAQQWFWQFYKTQMNKGVAGWWGDLGEPEKHPEDMYHNVTSFGVNRLMSANEVHNMYGHQWSKMLFQNFKKDYPSQRLFYLNRAGFAGSQRYNVFPWTGDVGRNWSGFRAQLLNLQSMSLSGIPYIHSDAGGFGGGDNDPELYIRWLQFAAYTPIFRPHGTALGDLEPGVKDIPSEPTFQEEPYKTIARNLIRNRYALLPYNYSLAFEQTTAGKPLIRPMFYYSTTDSNLLNASDQYMWGDAFLVAPVLHPNASTRKFYLPKGEWYSNNNNLVTGGQWITDSVSINDMPVYIKAGSMIPMWIIENYVSTAAYNAQTPVTFRYYPSAIKSSYTFFDDDGKSPQSITAKAFQQVTFTSSFINNIGYINLNANNWPAGFQKKFLIELPTTNITSASINGNPVPLITTGNQKQVEVVFNGKQVNVILR